MPKVDLNTKNNTWPFGVQLDYSCRLESVPPDKISRALLITVFRAKNNQIQTVKSNTDRQSVTDCQI